jgi:hypothetical protein
LSEIEILLLGSTHLHVQYPKFALFLLHQQITFLASHALCELSSAIECFAVIVIAFFFDALTLGENFLFEVVSQFFKDELIHNIMYGVE